MPIKACQGCLKDMFLTTTEAVDCFTGKELWVWGNQYKGQLGNNVGSNTLISSPIQTISAGSTWKSACVGGPFNFTAGCGMVAAIKTDGTLWSWGAGSHGSLGNNAAVNVSSPVQTISGGTNWKQASPGGSFTIAIKTDGTLWGWGLSNNGQLGNESSVSRSSPVQTVSGGTNWKQVSAGLLMTSAIKTDGTLWVWGFDQTGGLGDNTIMTKSSPIQTVSGGTNWKQVSTGSNLVGAVKTDGTLWVWGYNNTGQLGDNTRISRSSPVQTISEGTSWKQVSVGASISAAIKTDGSLWVWGYNGSGQLATNNLVSRSSPVQTVSGGTNWRCVETSTAGLGRGPGMGAIKTDGTLWTWGATYFGSLGDNTTINRSSPVQTVARGTTWKTVSTNAYMFAAIKETEF